jgi:hypothetical protein
MSSDQDLLSLLRAVLDADEKDVQLDNETLATTLGWDLDQVAGLLDEAKRMSLIWGHRGSRKPGPWFTELEVTVQGKRRLRTAR